ncbi:MAG: hypothetical protein JSU09_15760 [Bacteroidetes bacterium]|nr:hypothetical protein [Bacteroidota bacterium]
MRFLKIKERVNFSPPKIHFWVSILVGFGYSTFSFFLVVGMREMIRLSFYSSEQDSRIILSDAEILFYNFVIALICCLLGGSKCVEILTQTHQKPRIGSHLRNQINTSQSSLIWFSIYWLSKMSVLFALMFPIVAVDFKLFDYWYMFLIGIAVLFYSQWNKFSLNFANGRLIRNLFGLAYLFISISLSLTSFVFFRGANQVIRNSSVAFNYDIKTPKSEIGRRFDFRNYVPINLYLGTRSNSKKDSLRVVGSGPTVELSELNLTKYILDFKNCNDCNPNSAKLVISKDAKMCDVNRAFRVLANTNQRTIFLTTSYENWGIPFYLPLPCESDTLGPPQVYQNCGKMFSIFQGKRYFSQVRLLKNEIIFNKTKLNRLQLYDSTIQHYERDDKAILLITFDEFSNYESFIHVLDVLLLANNSKKTEYASKELKRRYSFSQSYFNDNAFYKKVSQRYPVNIVFYSEVDWEKLKENSQKR